MTLEGELASHIVFRLASSEDVKVTIPEIKSALQVKNCDDLVVCVATFIKKYNMPVDAVAADGYVVFTPVNYVLETEVKTPEEEFAMKIALGLATSAEIYVPIPVVTDALSLTDVSLLGRRVAQFAEKHGFVAGDELRSGKINFKRKPKEKGLDRDLSDPCFQCGKPVFIASYHLEPGQEYPTKYKACFCDEGCRHDFIIHILEIVADEF